MHVHAITAPHTGIAGRDGAFAPLTAPAYLHLRRSAAGYAVDALARALIVIGDHRRPANAMRRTLDEGRAEFRRVRDTVLLLEKPGTVTHDRELLHALASLFPFDPAVYSQLAYNPPNAHPRLCRACGCSGHDACVDHDDNVCTWFTPDLCSHCTTAAIDEAAAA